MSIDIDKLSTIVKTYGLQAASKKIIEVGNAINEFSNNIVNKIEDNNHKWRVYHSHGDEFNILIGDKPLKNINNKFSEYPLRAINGLKLIKYVKDKCNIGITIGITDADQSQATAKKYGYRGIVSMYWWNWPNIKYQNNIENWKKIAFIVENENDVKIVNDQVYSTLLPTDDKDKVSVKSFEIWNQAD